LDGVDALQFPTVLLQLTEFLTPRLHDSHHLRNPKLFCFPRSGIIFLFICLFYCLLIYSYVHTLFGTSVPPTSCLLPLHTTTLTFKKKLFCPLLQFCWRKDISNNKKDSIFASLRYG
jgi:hypothetical protein